jgi:hypothetical protein
LFQAREKLPSFRVFHSGEAISPWTIVSLPFSFNFDFFHSFLTFVQWRCHLDLQVESILTIKKARKEVV